ncbi:MAG: uroporphyrinogen decarboxylase, partial [Bacteroidia bacterium]|nr:uroporphyrinogen decarboxylase [Bacteroidia bacterium]
GVLNKDLFIEFCLPYLNRIREELRDAKMIYFPKDGWYALESLKEINFDVISLDWTITPGYARMIFGNGQILQGNMDPSVLYADDSIISTESLGIMSGFGRNHIFNLGHGVYPDIDKDKVKHLVQCIKEYEYPKS